MHFICFRNNFIFAFYRIIITFVKELLYEKDKAHNPFIVSVYYSYDYFCNCGTETAKLIFALENYRKSFTYFISLF